MVEMLDSRKLLSAAATFAIQAVVSNPDPTQHLFNIPGNSTSPFTLLRGGTGTMESINGFPIAYALAGGVPSNFTFSFGASSPSDAPALTLTAFDDGLSDGIGKQVFTNVTGDVNTVTVYLSGKAVASGKLDSLTILTNTEFVSTGVGVFTFTSADGEDPTVFNEFMSVSGGTGQFSFHLGTFTFSGAPSGYGSGAAQFSAMGTYDTQATINAAPFGTANTVTTLENLPYVFKASDFGFTDPHNSPPDGFMAVKITTLPLVGSLTDDGLPVTAGSYIPVTQINAGLLKFTPVLYAHAAPYASFTFQVQDNGGTLLGGVDIDPTPRTMTISVTPVNQAPVGVAKTVSILENGSYTFKTADFGFSDSHDTPPNSLQAVKITTLPSKGTLKDDGVEVTAGTRINVGDITSGNLVYTPTIYGFGVVYSTFTFQVQDNGGIANGGVNTDPTPRRMTFAVTHVNQAPVGTPKTVTTQEDAPYVFNVNDFGFTDPHDSPPNNLLSVRITTLPTLGSLTDNGSAVTVGEHIPLADLLTGKLKFTPVTDEYGLTYASFTFQVQDTGGTANGGVDTDPAPRKMTIDVQFVNHAPVGTAKTVTTSENTPYVFKVADFGFTDPNDNPPNSLLAVKITTLPTAGTLTDNGVAVSAGNSIPVADIATGKLKFTPNKNGTGAMYASFMFQVQDNGGTANGGIDIDPLPKLMTISVN